MRSISCAFILLAVVLCCATMGNSLGLLSSLSNTISKGSSKCGFVHMGSLKAKTSGTGVQSTSYFISSYKKTQDGALLDCRNIFSGKLLTIYTKEEDEFIRIRLQELNLGREQVYTAGRYNADKRVWEWLTTTTPCYYENWMATEPVVELANFSIQLLGESSSYGWVSRISTNDHRFICQIVT